MSQQVAVPPQEGSEGAGRLRIPVPVLLLALLAGMLIPAGSAAAAGWLPPVNASATVSSPTPAEVISLQDLAVDGEGNAVAAWVQDDLFGPPRPIEAATRPAGGEWSEPVPITAPNESKVALKLVVNDEGDAALVWLGYGGGVEVARVATRPAGGEWSEPVALSDPAGEAIEPDVAIDAQGTVTAIWVAVVGPGEGIAEAATLPAGGEWSEPVELSEPGRAARSPQIAVDSQGAVTAVWILNTGTREDGVVQSTSRPAGGEWSTEPVDISGAGGLASLPRLAVDPQGDATMLWQQQDIAAPSGFRIYIQTAERVDGTWSDPLSLTREDWISHSPELTVDQQGNVTAIWPTGQPGTVTRYLQVRSRSADGSWDAPVDLVTANGLLEPEEGDYELAADSQGNVTATWLAWSVPTYVVRSARLPVGGTWSTPVTLSSQSGYALFPQLAVDPQGYATVLWSGYQAGAQAVRSRVFDRIAPELRDLVVPATGTVGQPVVMSVDPFDLWSPVTSSWDFGDARSGTGAAVSHCYSSPGERTVTITGTDQAANATSESRTISIKPDPALAPGTDPCRPPELPGDPGPPNDPRPPNSGGHTDPGPGPTAPVVSDLRQTSSRWRMPGARGRSRLPIGTTFRFKLDRPAGVQLAFSRIAAGRQEGRRCVKATKANDEEPRCNRSQARGTLEIAGQGGENAYGFQGRMDGHALEPGRYRLLVTAFADGKTSAAASIEFTITR